MKQVTIRKGSRFGCLVITACLIFAAVNLLHDVSEVPTVVHQRQNRTCAGREGWSKIMAKPAFHKYVAIHGFANDEEWYGGAFVVPGDWALLREWRGSNNPQAAYTKNPNASRDIILRQNSEAAICSPGNSIFLS